MILSMASPVFEAMFYGGLAESNSPIEIPDVQPDAFSAMLQWVKFIKLRKSLICQVYIFPHKTYLNNLKLNILVLDIG